MISPEELKNLAKKSEGQNKTFFRNIKPGKANSLDKITHLENDKVFAKINCLDCAYCCKHLGPRLTQKDIREMAHALNLKETVFEKKYIRIDEDGDYIFNALPCPFLDSENYCLVYENRPRACRDYPHTHQPEVLRKKTIHIKNTFYCPAVFEIFENVKKTWK
jgi:hypothetical protein